MSSNLYDHPSPPPPVSAWPGVHGTRLRGTWPPRVRRVRHRHGRTRYWRHAGAPILQAAGTWLWVGKIHNWDLGQSENPWITLLIFLAQVCKRLPKGGSTSQVWNRWKICVMKTPNIETNTHFSGFTRMILEYLCYEVAEPNTQKKLVKNIQWRIEIEKCLPCHEGINQEQLEGLKET